MLEDGFSFKSSLQYTPTDEAKGKGKKNPMLKVCPFLTLTHSCQETFTRRCDIYF